jgi:large subunit ribosomal protein L10
LPQPEKVAAIEELKERIQDSQVVVMTRYVGINVEQVTRLRKGLREKGIRLKVYKNTLAKRALDELGLSGASAFMDGPTAWAFSKDAAAAPKLLKDFAKEVDKVAMLGGVLSGKVVTAKQLESLADLPSQEVLIGQVVGTIAAPLRNFMGVVSALPRNLVNVLDQIKKQKEEQAA